MYDSVLLVALTALVSSVLSIPFSGPLHFRDNVGSTLVGCSTTSKPCKVIVKVERSGLIPEQTYTSPPLCDCQTSRCPTDWNDAPERTITRYLRSKDKVMTMQLKFCNNIEPQRVCLPDESALVIKGRTMVPQEIVDFRCRCPHNRPMVVKSAWYHGFEHYQEYVCEMPRCTENGQCMTIKNNEEITYNCDCGQGKACRRRYPLLTGRCDSSNLY